MKLIVNELHSELNQTVKPEQNTQVEAIRLYLYKHNNPAGSFKVEIRDANNQLIAESTDIILSTDISSSSFYHGFIRFYISAHLQKNVEYKIVLKATAYTFSQDSFIGWCNSWDLSSYPFEYVPTNSFSYPLKLEIWDKSRQ